MDSVKSTKELSGLMEKYYNQRSFGLRNKLTIGEAAEWALRYWLSKGDADPNVDYFTSSPSFEIKNQSIAMTLDEIQTMVDLIGLGDTLAILDPGMKLEVY
jgi:hypothetical protein